MIRLIILMPGGTSLVQVLWSQYCADITLPVQANVTNDLTCFKAEQYQAKYMLQVT